MPCLLPMRFAWSQGSQTTPARGLETLQTDAAARPCVTSVPAWSDQLIRRLHDRKTCISRDQPSLITRLPSFLACYGISTAEYAPAAVHPDACSGGGAGGPEGQLNGAPMADGTFDAERGLMTLPGQHDVQEHEGEDRAGL